MKLSGGQDDLYVLRVGDDVLVVLRRQDEIITVLDVVRRSQIEGLRRIQKEEQVIAG